MNHPKINNKYLGLKNIYFNLYILHKSEILIELYLSNSIVRKFKIIPNEL